MADNTVIIQAAQKVAALGQRARVVTDEGPLARLDVFTHTTQGSIYLQGAHVARFHPRGGDEVLFISRQSRFERETPIRGGVPICFPWFGPKAGNPDAPAHGFARNTTWRLEELREIEQGNILVEMALTNNPLDDELWPHAFELRFIAVFGRSLTMTLRTTNRNEPDGRAFTVESALHTYLNVGDIERVRIHGLENTEYIDKVDGMKRKRQPAERITFSGETDRVYQNTHASCVIMDDALDRRMTIDKAGSRSTVVWNPWTEKARRMADLGDDQWRNFVCVETANAGECAVALQPGQSHDMRAVIRIS